MRTTGDLGRKLVPDSGVWQWGQKTRMGLGTNN